MFLKTKPKVPLKTEELHNVAHNSQDLSNIDTPLHI
jgi:hypothetical protein